jgi:hypothetical protein
MVRLDYSDWSSVMGMGSCLAVSCLLSSFSIYLATETSLEVLTVFDDFVPKDPSLAIPPSVAIFFVPHYLRRHWLGPHGQEILLRLE